MPFNITPKIIFPGLIHLCFDTQYEMASTMIRMQEFYESPYEGIRGCYFTLEQYMDEFVKRRKDGVFTYLEEVAGCNVPGDAVNEFFNRFDDGLMNDLMEKEKHLKRVIDEAATEFYSMIPVPGNLYYVIATVPDDRDEVKHEIAHAMYYLFPEYRKEMDSHLEAWGMDKELVGRLHRCLRKEGYAGDKFKDELQAYFATSDMEDLYEFFGEEEEMPWYIVLKVKLTFRKFYKEYVENEKEVLS